MTTVEDLIYATIENPVNPSQQAAVFEDDLLAEATIADIRIIPPAGRVAILLDLRSALQLRGANTGLLLIRTETNLSWSTPPSKYRFSAWVVVGSRARRSSQGVSLELNIHPGSKLTAAGTALEFFEIEVSDIGEEPPNYVTDPPRHLGDRSPTWASYCSVYATYQAIGDR